MEITEALFEAPRDLEHKHQLTYRWAQLLPRGEVTFYHRRLWWGFREFALERGMSEEAIYVLKEPYESWVTGLGRKSWIRRHAGDFVILALGSAMVTTLWFTFI